MLKHGKFFNAPGNAQEDNDFLRGISIGTINPIEVESVSPFMLKSKGSTFEDQGEQGGKESAL